MECSSGTTVCCYTGHRNERNLWKRAIAGCQYIVLPSTPSGSQHSVTGLNKFTSLLFHVSSWRRALVDKLKVKTFVPFVKPTGVFVSKTPVNLTFHSALHLLISQAQGQFHEDASVDFQTNCFPHGLLG